MDENQTDRRRISLEKDNGGTAPVREAYPVYKNGKPDAVSLEKNEYRNMPQQPQPQVMYQDPPPAVNRYNTPEVQPANYNDSPALKNTNDDLGRYYDYEVQPDVPVQPIPPVQPQAAMPPANVHATKFCKFCGEKIEADSTFCNHCGGKVENVVRTNPAQSNSQAPNYQPLPNYQSAPAFDAFSDKTKSTAILLAALGFLGFAGIHRFYAGKPVSGIVYFLTGGICGIGTLVDILKLASGTFTDGVGRMIKK